MKSFPPIALAPSLPDWPRLMPIALAAAYCGISETTFREVRPAEARKVRGCRLYDRRELDAWADALGSRSSGGPGAPVAPEREESHKRELERRFLDAEHKG